jgi:hydrogenase maturation factor
VDVSETVYVYIHLTLGGYEYTGSASNGEEFTFEIENTVTGDVFTVDVPMNGGKKLTLPAGTYIISENAPGWIPIFEVNGVGIIGDTATVEIKAGKVTNVKVVNEEDETGDFNSVPSGSLTFTVDAEAWKNTAYNAMGSITTGGIRGAGGDKNNNWFNWTELPVAAILAGDTFVGDLINGDKEVKVGEFTAYADADGNLVIVLFSNDGKVKINTDTQIAFGNKNAQKTNSDINGSNTNNGSGLYKISANSLGAVNNAIVIPAADIAKVTDDKATQYLFIHTGIGAQTTVHDISANYADVEFFVVVKDSDGIIVDFLYLMPDECLALVSGESFTLGGLSPGIYTIEVTGPNGWKLTYDAVAEVFDKKDTPVDVLAELTLNFKVGP